MELSNFFESLKQQEKEYGVKISFSPDVIRDKDYLDCLWYGGEVGRIHYKGYDIVIGAFGEITLSGKIQGEPIFFQEKNNSGSAFWELGKQLDDALLHKLLDSEDSSNYLVAGNNNWFEVDLIGSGKEWIDLSHMDNVLPNNILDCFKDVSQYFKYVDLYLSDAEQSTETNEQASSKEQKPSALTLEFIGIDDWDCPTYKDQFGRLWKDINLGNSENPSLYSVSTNEMDGEPCSPIQQEYTFQPVLYRRNPYEFQYRMLSRMQSDCEYFLGYGGRNPKILSDDPQDHIDRMKELWRGFPKNEKPEWLTWEQLLAYEKAILSPDLPENAPADASNV